MLHFEVHDRILDDAQGGEVGRGKDVGNVAVHEDVTRFQAEDGGFGDAAVGAADPKDAGSLAFGEGGEEGGVCSGCVGGPGVVGSKDVGKRVWVGGAAGAVF